MKRSILYLHRTQGQGAEGSHIRGMVDGFREHGWDVDIVGPPGVDPYRFHETSKNKSSLFGRMLHWFAARAPQWCFELVEVAYNGVAWIRLRSKWRAAGGYGFLYERYALNSFAGSLFASSRGCPLVLEVNDATVIERSRPLVLKALARWIEHLVLQRATLIITITNQFKVLLVEQHGISADQIMVLPNAIDPAKYVLDEDKRFSRAKLDIPENATVLGCVGAFVPWHGLEFLVETMAGQCEEYDLFFLFVGDGPVRLAVEESAKQLGVQSRVRFTGFVDPFKVPYYLDLVDVCVIPSSNVHCSPMKLFEYMAAGKPVVLPTFQPLLDIVTDDKHGVFFAPGNQQELRQAILRLIENPSLCATFGRNGKKLVTEKYTWTVNTSKVLRLIEKLLWSK